MINQLIMISLILTHFQIPVMILKHDQDLNMVSIILYIVESNTITSHSDTSSGGARNFLS